MTGTDRIHVSHASVQWDEDVRAAQNARWAAEDAARRAAERDPRQDAIKAATSLARARPHKGTNPPGKAPVRAPQRVIRPVPRQPSDSSDGTTLWVSADELDYLAEALETHARYASITDRRSIP